MPIYTNLLIDMDRTLFDFNAAEKNALMKTCSYIGCQYSSNIHLAYHNINNSVWKEYELGQISQKDLQIKRFMLFQNIVGTHFNNEYINNYYLLQLAEQNQLIPGALETIIKLFEHNCILYIATNGTSLTQRKRFFSSPISNYFTDIFISEEIGFQKPQFEFFDFCIQKINVSKNNILMIGDSLSSDILGGSLYGIDTCYIDPSYDKGKNINPSPTHIISNISDLLTIVLDSPPCL